MNALASPDAAFAAALASITKPPRTELDRLDRVIAQDRARDAWIAARMPVAVDELWAQDASLARGLADVDWTAAPLLAALRTGDALEFLRLVQNAVRQELAHDADLMVEEQAYERFPEGAA